MVNRKRKRASSAAAISGSPRRTKEEEGAAAAAGAGEATASNGGGNVVDKGKEKEASYNYEKMREERIKENLERIQKLGIINLSVKLEAAFCGGSSSGPINNAYRRPKANQPPSPVHHPILPPAPPPRRSSRLQNASPVSYAELGVSSSSASSEGNGGLVWQGEREEVYGEEHAALLGSCETSWTLFVDGYDKHGRRIYDQVNGKTCHQCRQKTLGHHTHCSKCNLVQGQFCGDCLYMRYGEHVLEVKKNVNWICPVCRGICNCSLCRTKKGWAPTGTLYKKVASLGFKSVAHYLIQTRQRQTNPGDQISSRADSSSKAAELLSNVEDTLGPGALDRKTGLKSEIPGEHGNEVLSFANTVVPSQSLESPLEEGSKDLNHEVNRAKERTSSDISIGSTPRPKDESRKAPGEVEKLRVEDSIAGRLRKRLGRGSPIS